MPRRPARRHLLAGAGALLFPAAMLAVSGVRPSIASALAAELVYLWLLVFFTARRWLTGPLGPVTAYAAIAVGAALTLAPLGLTSPLCSDGIGSPWCRREVGAWALVGLLATLLMVAVTAGRQGAAAAAAVVRRLTSALRRIPPAQPGISSSPNPRRPGRSTRRQHGARRRTRRKRRKRRR